MTPKWEAIEVESGVCHIVPIGDLVDHDQSDDCVCVPTSELVVNEGESDGWIVTHHSLDGRETAEAR